MTQSKVKSMATALMQVPDSLLAVSKDFESLSKESYNSISGELKEISAHILNSKTAVEALLNHRYKSADSAAIQTIRQELAQSVVEACGYVDIL